MSMSIAQSRFQRHKNVLFTEIEGEAVLLELDSSTYFGLDELGTTIWKLFERGQTMEEVVATLLESYEVSEENLYQDLQQFVEQLVEAKLVVPTRDE